MGTRPKLTGADQAGAEEAGAGPLGRALQIVSLVSEQPGISLPRIAAALGVHKSTAYRLCSTLEDAGYLARERQLGVGPGSRARYQRSGYRLGLWVFVLGSRAVAALALKRQAPRIMRRLAEQAQLPAYLSVVWNGLSICIDEIPGPAGSVWPGSAVGVPLPVHATASGKLFLAQLPETSVRAVLGRTGGPLASRVALKTTKSIEEIVAELERVRTDGYAFNDEETEYGVRYIGVAVCDPPRHFQAGLTLGATVEQRTPEALVALLPHLRAAAAALEAQIAREPAAPV